VTVADVRGSVEAAAREAVEEVREEGGLLERRVHDARVVLDEDLLAGGLVPMAHGGVERLWREAHGLLVEAEREPVGTKLLGRVVVEELRGHGGLDVARA